MLEAFLDSLKTLFPAVTAGALIGFAVVWFSKSILSKLISSSIEKGYKEQFASFDARLKTISSHETKILVNYVDKYLEMAEEVNLITHEYHQIIGKMLYEYNEHIKKGKDKMQANELANRMIDKPAAILIEKAMLLKRHYVFLPSKVIESLQDYENAIFEVLRLRKFNKKIDVEIYREKLTIIMRQSTAELLSGKTKLDQVLMELPQNGFTPQYLKEMLEIE